MNITGLTSNDSMPLAVNITCNGFISLADFNFTEIEFPNPDILTKVLDHWDYVKIAASLLTIVAIFLGNAGVVIAVAVNRSLRNTINYYLTNLAVADILIGAFCLWVHLVNNLTEPLYLLGPIMCKINGFVQMTCLTSSVLTLVAISCDRFVAIWFPLRTRVTKQRTGLIIASIWLVSVTVSMPFFIYRKYYELQWKNLMETQCIESWPVVYHFDPIAQDCVASYPHKKFYYTIVTITLFFVPVVVMVISYSLILWRLWVHQSPGEVINQQQRMQQRSKKRIIKMVFMVLIAFVISWMPLQALVFYSQFFHSTHRELPGWFPPLSYIFTFMAYSNSALNPLIYGGFNQKFRQALYSMLRCHFDMGHQRNRRNVTASEHQSSVRTSAFSIMSFVNKNREQTGPRR